MSFAWVLHARFGNGLVRLYFKKDAEKLLNQVLGNVGVRICSRGQHAPAQPCVVGTDQSRMNSFNPGANPQSSSLVTPELWPDNGYKGLTCGIDLQR